MNRTSLCFLSSSFAALLLAGSPVGASQPCVAGLEAQFSNLAAKPSKISLWYRTPKGLDTNPPFPGVLVNVGNEGGDLVPPEHLRGIGKVQGMQRFVVDDTPYVAYTADASFGDQINAHLFVAELGSKAGFGSTPIDTNRSSGAHSAPHDDRNVKNLILNEGRDPFRYNRPGGFQVVDNIAFIPVFDLAKGDHRTFLYVVDLDNPREPYVVDGAPFELKAVKRGAAVGVLSLGNGEYLLVVRGHYKVRGRKHRYFTFYRLHLELGGGVGAPRYLSTIEERSPFSAAFDDYQSINLLRDCETGTIYLIGFDDDQDVNCGGGLLGGNSYADLFRVDHELSPKPLFTRIRRRGFGDLTGAGCAGAGTFVADDASLSTLFMKHLGVPKTSRDFLGRKVVAKHGVVKMFEFASRSAERTGLTLYEDARFRSESRRFVTGAGNLGHYQLNDKVGSVDVHSGEWELCKDPGYVNCVRVSRDVAHLGDWNLNNRLSSARRVVEQNPRLLGDVDGDGRADAVFFGDRWVYVALGHQDGDFDPAYQTVRNFTFNSGGWRAERHPRLLGDVDGDGRSDIVGFGSWNVYVSLGREDGSFASARATIPSFTYNRRGWRIDRHPRLLGDVNGDGRSDIVGFGNSRVLVALGQADGTFAPARSTLANFTYDAGWRTERHPRLLGDVNGDGRSDIVAFGGSRVYVALGRSDGTFSGARSVLANFAERQGWRTDLHTRLLGDVNGDGRSDIVGFGGAAVWVALGRAGGNFSTARPVLYDLSSKQGWRADRHLRLLTDVDGDGRNDIVGFGGASVFVATARWNGTFSAVQKAFDGLAYADGWRLGRHPRLTGDVDGDGSSDIVGFGGRHVFLSRGDSLGELSAPVPALGNLLY